MTVSPELPDVPTLMEMRRQGKPLKEIADAIGVEPSVVWAALMSAAEPGEARAGDRSEVRTVEEMTGWTIEARHRNSGVMRHLETFNQRQQDGAVDEAALQDLLDWVQGLNKVSAVVDYDPAAPPNDLSLTGGFFVRKREPGDEHFFREHG